MTIPIGCLHHCVLFLNKIFFRHSLHPRRRRGPSGQKPLRVNFPESFPTGVVVPIVCGDTRKSSFREIQTPPPPIARGRRSCGGLHFPRAISGTICSSLVETGTEPRLGLAFVCLADWFLIKIIGNEMDVSCSMIKIFACSSSAFFFRRPIEELRSREN